MTPDCCEKTLSLSPQMDRNDMLQKWKERTRRGMRATKCRHVIGPTYQSVDTQTSLSRSPVICEQQRTT